MNNLKKDEVFTEEMLDRLFEMCRRGIKLKTLSDLIAYLYVYKTEGYYSDIVDDNFFDLI